MLRLENEKRGFSKPNVTDISSYLSEILFEEWLELSKRMIVETIKTNRRTQLDPNVFIKIVFIFDAKLIGRHKFSNAS